MQSSVDQDQALKYAQKKYVANDDEESIPDTSASTDDINSNWSERYAEANLENKPRVDNQSGTDNATDVVPQYDKNGKRSWRIIHK